MKYFAAHKYPRNIAANTWEGYKICTRKKDQSVDLVAIVYSKRDITTILNTLNTQDILDQLEGLSND